MFQLQVGKVYTNSQIAEWFGLKAKKFSNKNHKDRKLEQLKLFANYQLVGDRVKKIYIKQVYQPVYNKKGSQNFQIISSNLEQYWKDNGRGLDTCKRVGEAMYKDGLTDLSYSTTLTYVGQDKRNKYGINYMQPGNKGYSIYAWGKLTQDQEDGQVYLVPLTPQEEEIKNKLIRKYFGDTTDKQVFVQAMVDEGQITREQAWEVLQELTNMKDKFSAFKAEFEVAIDSPIGRGTRLITTNIEQESAF